MRVKIGELARMSGCQVVTIRFYEKEGLLSEPERTGANYRVYNDKDIERLGFILHCRRHGMKLSEIRELLAFKDNPKSDCSWVSKLIETHISNVSEQIESLSRLREQLKLLSTKCSGGEKTCGILESLNDAGGCSYCEDLRCKGAAL